MVSDRPDELVGGAGDEAPPRRWPLWLVAAVAVAAGLVLARPDLSLLADSPPPETTERSNREAPSLRNTLQGVTWDARGDLVDDYEFVRAAVARMRQERPELARVFFAGRLSDGSRLMLAGSDVNRGVVATSVHALHVPVGTPLEGASVTEGSALVDPQQVLAWATRGRDDRVRAVVLARPGPVAFELSSTVDFSPSTGAPARRWAPVEAEDGVLVADLGPDADPIIAVRASGPGVFSLPLLVRVVEPAPASPVLAVAGTEDPAYRGPAGPALSQGLREQAGAVVDLRAAERRVLWSGAPWKQRRLALVLLTRSDGRRFQALVGEDGRNGFPAGVRALPEDAPDRLPWLLEPFSFQDPTLLLVPTGDGSILYKRPGVATKTLQIGEDGVVGLVEPGPSPPSASGAQVTVLDEQGRILLRTRLPEPGFDDPLGLD